MALRWGEEEPVDDDDGPEDSDENIEEDSDTEDDDPDQQDYRIIEDLADVGTIRHRGQERREVLLQNMPRPPPRKPSR